MDSKRQKMHGMFEIHAKLFVPGPSPDKTRELLPLFCHHNYYYYYYYYLLLTTTTTTIMNPLPLLLLFSIFFYPLCTNLQLNPAIL
jgi:hypothetical protein